MLDSTMAAKPFHETHRMHKQKFSRRTVLLGAAALGSAPCLSLAADNAEQRYAVMSIIGDKITLVGQRQSVGSNLDQNERRVIAISAPALDNSALLAVDDVVKRLQPKAVTALLASRDPKLFALQDQPLDKPGDAAESVAAVKTLLQQTKATRLILVAPYRAEARFQLQDSFIGSGKISGLGFYVDNITRIKLVNSGESGEGYLAPYAYISVSLIDADTMVTLRRQLLTESRLVPTSAAKNATLPWDALTNDQKVEMLQALIRRGINRAIPELLSGA